MTQSSEYRQFQISHNNFQQGSLLLQSDHTAGTVPRQSIYSDI